MASHKKGLENLIRPTSERAREIGRLGGLKYGENVRRRKALKAIAKDLLFCEINVPDELKNHEELMKSYGFDIYCAADIIMFTCIRKAIQGDHKAIELLMRITGELSHHNNINIDIDIDKNDNNKEITLESVVNEKKRLISLLEKSNDEEQTKDGNTKARKAGASTDHSKAGRTRVRRKED